MPQGKAAPADSLGYPQVGKPDINQPVAPNKAEVVTTRSPITDFNRMGEARRAAFPSFPGAAQGGSTVRRKPTAKFPGPGIPHQMGGS